MVNMPDITAEELRRLLSYDAQTGLFTWLTGRRSGKTAGCHSDGYIYIRVNERLYRAHRLAWLYVYGEWPNGQLDHINRVKDDNRVDNLRIADFSQNAQNAGAHKDNASGVRGIFWDKSRCKWVAELTIDGKLIFKQRFNSKEEATIARKQAEEKYHPFKAC